MALAIIVLKITGHSGHSKAKTRFHFDLNLGDPGKIGSLIQGHVNPQNENFPGHIVV